MADSKLDAVKQVCNGPGGIAADFQCNKVTENVSQLDQQLRREGEEALKSLIELTNSNDGWNLEKTVNGIKCYCKPGDGRKIVKADAVVDTSAEHLWSILYPGECTPEWNSHCTQNKRLYTVDESLDLVYTVSSTIGPVSPRDFVCARQVACKDGSYYLACISTTTDLKPEQSGRVRGENGPCGYVVIPINSSTAQFLWVLNSNMKGWLPQFVVDQTGSSALLGAYRQLQLYAKEHT